MNYSSGLTRLLILSLAIQMVRTRSKWYIPWLGTHFLWIASMASSNAWFFHFPLLFVSESIKHVAYFLLNIVFHFQSSLGNFQLSNWSSQLDFHHWSNYWKFLVVAQLNRFVVSWWMPIHCDNLITNYWNNRIKGMHRKICLWNQSLFQPLPPFYLICTSAPLFLDLIFFPLHVQLSLL